MPMEGEGEGVGAKGTEGGSGAPDILAPEAHAPLTPP